MKRLISLLIPLIGLTVLLGGCGGGSEEEATPTPTATALAATATPGATPRPTSTPAPGTYEVQPGDTLSDIADQFGVDVKELAAANDISDPDLIHPGQILKIPAEEP